MTNNSIKIERTIKYAAQSASYIPYLMNFDTNSTTPVDRRELRWKIQVLGIAFGKRKRTCDFKVVGSFDRCARSTVADGGRR
jgi:hypothetical protein